MKTTSVTSRKGGKMKIELRGRADWEKWCLRERGRVLDGIYAHYCNDWDDLTMDETCPEWPCACYHKDKDFILNEKECKTKEVPD